MLRNEEWIRAKPALKAKWLKVHGIDPSKINALLIASPDNPELAKILFSLFAISEFSGVLLSKNIKHPSPNALDYNGRVVTHFAAGSSWQEWDWHLLNFTWLKFSIGLAKHPSIWIPRVDHFSANFGALKFAVSFK